MMLSEVTIRTHLVTEEKVQEVLNQVSNSEGYIVVDTETTITDSIGNRNLLGVSVSLPDGSICYFPFSHQMGLDFGDRNLSLDYLPKLWDSLADKSLVFHNAKFDLQIMEKFGFRRRGPFYCTMIMSHIADPYPAFRNGSIRCKRCVPNQTALRISYAGLLGIHYSRIF